MSEVLWPVLLFSQVPVGSRIFQVRYLSVFVQAWFSGAQTEPVCYKYISVM